jgi:hypothetical protein
MTFRIGHGVKVNKSPLQALNGLTGSIVRIDEDQTIYVDMDGEAPPELGLAQGGWSLSFTKSMHRRLIPEDQS